MEERDPSRRPEAAPASPSGEPADAPAAASEPAVSGSTPAPEAAAPPAAASDNTGNAGAAPIAVPGDPAPVAASTDASPAPPGGVEAAAGAEAPMDLAPVESAAPESAAAPADAGGYLEELSEPLPAAVTTAALEPGAVIQGPDGASFRIVRLVKPGVEVNEYEAVAADTEKPVTIREATGAGKARLEHEAAVLEGLDGPMFPRRIAAFESGEKTYHVAEAVAGPTLAEALAEGKLSFPQILSALAQVAFALTKLHERGWAYLGLRPSAVTLGKPVKLTDFAYATRLGEKPAAPFYHAGYSPPEVLGEHPVDVRDDVYSLGALLFHAVNGQPIAETGVELSTWEPPTPLGGVPQVLDRTLGARDTRYASMAELHRALLRLARRYAPVVHYSIAAATNIGLEASRSANQDAYAYLTGSIESDEGPQPWAMVGVSDGMGGMAAGEVASDAAVRGLITAAAADLGRPKVVTAAEQVEMVRRWMHAANEPAVAAMEKRGVRGGATLVIGCILGRRLTVAHVGDCRLYLVRGDAITPLTRDHSLVMALAMQGEISVEEIRNHPDRSTITRSLGDRHPLPAFYVDTLQQMTGAETLELQAGDILLLASDGQWEPVLEPEMLQTVRQNGPDLHAAAHDLIRLALQRGAPDNTTILLFRLDESTAQNGV